MLKDNIKNYNLGELQKIVEDLGEKKYRAEQIFNWIYKENVTSFDEMVNLPLSLRNTLKERILHKKIKSIAIYYNGILLDSEDTFKNAY